VLLASASTALRARPIVAGFRIDRLQCRIVSIMARIASGRVRDASWVSVPGKHRNWKAAWGALHDMMAAGLH
jgi:hypothetical protein